MSRAKSEPHDLGIEALLAAQEGNIGSFTDPQPSSARHIFRQLYHEGLRFHVEAWQSVERGAADANAYRQSEFGVNWLAQLASQGAPAVGEVVRE